MEIKGLIFDFDGTILDTEYPEFVTWQEIYRSYNAELNLMEWAKTLGTTYKEFDPIHNLRQRTIQPISTDEIIKRRNEQVIQIIHNQPLLPGVMNYLHDAKKMGLKIGIASSSSGQWVPEHVERLGLTPFFDVIITGNTVAQVKPAPDLFLLALERMGLSPEEALVLEDSPNGIKAARRAGLWCAVIPNEISKHLDLSEADLIINSLEEVPLRLLLEKSRQARETR